MLMFDIEHGDNEMRSLLQVSLGTIEWRLLSVSESDLNERE